MTQLIGILNVTPDSFSGDGALGDQALTHAVQLVRDGADMLDVGAESTRPGAAPLTPEEEWERLAPVLATLATQPLPLSLDTRHAETAQRALNLGIRTINDVSGLRDPTMLALLAQHDGDIVVMHALTIPADPAQVLAPDVDPIAAILRWKNETTVRAIAFGIAPERLIYDPGIGFGKTPQQSLALVLAAAQLKQSGGRWLFGHSRKSFLTLFTDEKAAARDPLTLAFSAMLARAGADYLRVHNIAAHRVLLTRLCT